MLILAVLVLGIGGEARADKRAFVVQVGKYAAGWSGLKTPRADAQAITGVLQTLNFAVTRLDDPNGKEFATRWASYLESLKPGDIALFFFAGHGVQIDGANYLQLRDSPSPAAGEAAVLEQSINFYELMEQLDARKLKASVYILDACRANPFATTTGRKGKSSLGQGKGLARMESVFNTFVMYSAGANEEALDNIADVGNGENSPYVARLLPHLKMPQLSLLDVAKRVQIEVEADAREKRTPSHQQRPAYFDGILGQFYLALNDQPGTLTNGDRVSGPSVVRLGGFATWDSDCDSRPAPRISVKTPPKHGRILTRFESFPVSGAHFGPKCPKSSQRGIGAYYMIDETNKDKTAIDVVEFEVKHWSVAPVTSVTERFEIDLATRYSRRKSK